MSQFILATFVLVAFTTAPILHTVIPHTHDEVVVHGTLPDGVYPDTHEDGHPHPDHDESPIWSSLHSAARHEQKKVLDVVTTNIWELVFSISAAIIAGSIFFIPINPLLFDPLRGRYLQRGIAPYRRFG